MTPDELETLRETSWVEKAVENVDNWGEQNVDTLLLATQEELGEVTQAHLEARAEGAPPSRVLDELDDLAALMYQLRWAIDRKYPGVERKDDGQ